jgi:hypothetical protein
VVKRQKTYSVPMPWAEWLKQLYETNKKELEQLNIMSDVDLLKVLTRLGVPRLLSLLKDLDAKEHKMIEPPHEGSESPSKDHKKTP